MRTFRLKPGIALRPHAVPPHLADGASGRTFPLTQTEVSVLQALGKGATSVELLERGLSLSRVQLSAVLGRLAAAGFLEVEGVPTPRPVTQSKATQPKPRLRSELSVKKAPRPGHVEVRDLRSGHSFTFFEFELTVARMFDGHHTLEQVAAAAERLGLRVTRETLETYLQQLDSLGLLERRPAATPTPPPARKLAGPAWSPELTEMFNCAVGHARAGQYTEAISYLEELLNIDPKLSEASSLLDDVRGCLEGQLSGVSFESLHGAPPPPPRIPPVRADSLPGEVGPTAHVVRPSQWRVSEVLKSLDLPAPPRAADGRK